MPDCKINMKWRSAFAYAWDLAERGTADAAAELREIGLNAVTVAGSYHAGKFLRPRAAGKVYFPEDGTIYFRHDPSLYGRIQPLRNSILQSSDVIGELCDAGNIAVGAWLVLLHNSRLGFEHSSSCVRNAFGDPLYYSLCPSSGEIRAYATALVRDVTTNYPVAGVSLETPGFLPYVHGYHHEFALVRGNRWLDNLLGLCFCEHCVRNANADGLNIRALKDRVAADVSDYLSGDADFPDDMAEAFWSADLATDSELSNFFAWRCGVVTSLVEELRNSAPSDAFVSVIPSVGRPTAASWYSGSDLKSLAAAAGIVEACFYEPSPKRVLADLFDVKRRMRGNGELRGILRPSFPDLDSADDVASAVKLLADGGVQGISFYNWGFLRQRNLNYIARAMSEFS